MHTSVERCGGDALSMVERYNVTVQFKQISDGGMHDGRRLRTCVSGRHLLQCLVCQTHQSPHRPAAANMYDYKICVNFLTFVC